MYYFLFFLMLLSICLIPALICLIFELAVFGKIWQKGVTITKVLSSYGVVSICLMITTISEPLNAYMHENCVYTGEEVAPCSNALYSVVSIVDSWLLAVMLVVALVSQLAYLHFIGRYIRLSEKS